MIRAVQRIIWHNLNSKESSLLTHVHVLPGAGQVLGQVGLIEPDVGVDDLLHQDAGNAEHGPAGVLQLT